MTVGDLQVLPYDEYENWLMYFDHRPVGWREDLRSSHIMSSMGAKDANKAFPSLKEMFAPRDDSAINSLKGSFIFSKMLGAEKGDKLDILKEL
jgi:hypothetical protein